MGAGLSKSSALPSSAVGVGSLCQQTRVRRSVDESSCPWSEQAQSAGQESADGQATVVTGYPAGKLV